MKTLALYSLNISESFVNAHGSSDSLGLTLPSDGKGLALW